jgi:RND family efflux transporter MFP subunit
MKILVKLIGFLMLVLQLSAAELNLAGSVISDNQKMITSRYMGFVKGVHVSEGEKVKKGQLLYEIDSKEIDSAKAQVELSISQAKLSLQMYQNQHQNIELNLERHKRLYKKDMVSRFDVENLELASRNLETMVLISKQQIEQAKARLQEVINQYRYLRVVAPNNAVVIEKNIKVGEMAMPGVPAITLSDLTNLRILTEIPESKLKEIRVGKKVEFTIPSIGLKGYGKIDSVIPSANPLTHTFKLKIGFDAKEYRVYPGMYATVKID